VAKLQKLGVAEKQIEPTWPNKVFRLDDMSIRATFAIPYAGDDLGHVGYLVSIDDGPTVYLTGDTGYHKVIADSVREHKPDILLTAINGTFNNLGPAEAALLGKQIDAKVIIPCHYDIFPCNEIPPHLLQTNLQILGIGKRYQELEHGKCFIYPT
jgi:L-ascorbate 6-phosphate lactonase